MNLVWIGLALLSVSWMFGLGYYHAPDWIAWALTVGGGVMCLLPLSGRLPTRREAAVALILAVPAAVLAPWPFRAAPLLITLGMLLCLVPVNWRWLVRVSSGVLLGGSLLLVQSLAVLAYEAFTSRSHDLPAPLAKLLAGAARLLGADAAAFGTQIALHSMRKIHYLGATWELLLDPPTFCFLMSGVAVILRQALPVSTKRQRWLALRSILLLLTMIALWLPLRSGLLMSLYLHDVLRTEYDEKLTAMRLFWNHWLHLVLLLCPAVFAWRLVPLIRKQTPAGASLHAVRRRFLAATLCGLAVALITTGILWDPVGPRKRGRVVVEESHPDPDKIWERTDKPFDTEWYGHLSGYNYYCIYDYCSRFFDMSRLTRRIDDAALQECDVLIIKVPTREYSSDEIRAVRRFVDRGGGLLLIGEHTNVFHSTEYLNPIAREFGFRFREDCLFGIDSVFEQFYEPPLVPHPIVQHMPPLDFATSCSIDAGCCSGRTVIRGRALKNLMADYHSDNFYPQPQDDAEMRYGSFVQLWSARHGEGRVVAFSDSTIFSNFSTFEPGKAELMLGMVEWLNHGSPPIDPRLWLVVPGALAMLVGLWITCGDANALVLCVSSGLTGWFAAALSVVSLHSVAMPPPQPQRPLVQVVMDRTVSSSPLPTNGFIAGEEDQFGIFERWVLRLGYFTARRSGPSVFDSDLLIVLHPDRPVSDNYRQRLVQYVKRGGKVLIIESPLNINSTASELLQPFDLAIEDEIDGGMLDVAGDWPRVPVDRALTVGGGVPFARIGGRPVGASAKHGDGLVVVVGFGTRFADANMGVTGDVIPDDELRQVFDLQFVLLRRIVESEAGQLGP